jgi:hypothetical protein
MPLPVVKDQVVAFAIEDIGFFRRPVVVHTCIYVICTVGCILFIFVGCIPASYDYTGGFIAYCSFHHDPLKISIVASAKSIDGVSRLLLANIRAAPAARAAHPKHVAPPAGSSSGYGRMSNTMPPTRVALGVKLRVF